MLDAAHLVSSINISLLPEPWKSRLRLPYPSGGSQGLLQGGTMFWGKEVVGGQGHMGVRW